MRLISTEARLYHPSLEMARARGVTRPDHPDAEPSPLAAAIPSSVVVGGPRRRGVRRLSSDPRASVAKLECGGVLASPRGELAYKVIRNALNKAQVPLAENRSRHLG